MDKKYDDYQIVTEVGVFGDLNIEDPTMKKVNKKNKSIEELIKESEENNKKINPNIEY